ncbi:hypothetical protein Marpi_0886 [Marinitoga piezophila KA3]|uniref:CYTH domain-containing protein n=1 Tax=Marinitoga piezophila (strain DSM 14283 / JCM 11233 / KA3) TaxID=443254 RepID=H2J7B0_MARPK|nr:MULTISPECIES: hypothetical protein [Marinitoga]AEX85302.1 hypothetical protein Marpi_0886 [Marinitoga piezophila KA3]APT75787.1 hypothetical protein LN42_04875 [Marinitoga sp. 1137]NUU97455.1 hypothetical protein [Marinitoga sp. 1138]
MSIEIERKYIISNDESEELIKKAIKKIGIVQWYIRDDINEIERYRLSIIKNNKDYDYKWTYAYKANTKIAHEKIEKERVEKPQELENLIKYKMVAKIRYMINDNPEIVVDEFVDFNKIRYNIEEKFLLEIEMKEEKKYKKEDFEEVLKKFDIETIKDVTEDFKYYNNRIAVVAKNIILNEIIEKIKEKL